MSLSDDTTDAPAAPRVASTLSGTNLERAGDYNQRVVLQAVRLHGPITRTELADIIGLTPPAIANITRRLALDGLLVEAGQRRGGRGQPATRFAVNPEGRFSLGVNVDRDHVTVLLLDLEGRVRAASSRDGKLGAPAAVARHVAKVTASLTAEAPGGRARVVGAGLSIPDDLGRIDLPDLQHADAWGAVDPAALFSEALGWPVLVENDAAAAAMGELQFGHGLHQSSFFYILFTAGLGGGLVLDGGYFRGATGRSGEIGFLPVHGAGGRARPLQELVSLSALYARLAAHGVGVGAPAELGRLGPDAARLVDAWLDEAAGLLTEPLATVSWLINPAAVVLGGRLPPPLLEALAARLRERLTDRALGAPVQTAILRAAVGEDAAAIGAALLPFQQHLLPSRDALMKVGDRPAAPAA